METVKIAVIGCGAVGSSFLYSAIHQGLASEYGLLDYNTEFARGQALDLEDAIPHFDFRPRIKVITDYKELKNYQFIVITAGRAQKEGETRLQMIRDNAVIMKGIAEQVKSSGFSGIVLICSNPVDVLTYIFQKVTGFDEKKVIGSGTVLDTNRLKVEVIKGMDVAPASLEGAFVLGEHGDSSLVTFSLMKVSGLSINRCEEVSYPNSPFCCSDYEEKLEKVVYKKAYEIISRKRATHYGIGVAMTKILKTIIYNTKEILPVSSILHGEYGLSDVAISVPTVVGSNGIERIAIIPLKEKEQNKLVASAKILQENIAKVRDLI
ncbi:L-lactate dehydrogenase [Microbacterium esteraromaticum]|uniref:L-lactate dehydrogenase n=1 Tax=Mycoplasma wenyonii TaxID=65123 RepID=A0A328PS34_9MOLU|nr:L-lactate dehydrogenase [Mycoplasma wenyonii]PYC99664.1 L-lactate dehydrogenase [Microbacterium esteraromaticum]RAO95127.1 L-lactate dehydrogenase [Mycoplasma wenyonii]